jgi:hypothetical protein
MARTKTSEAHRMPCNAASVTGNVTGQPAGVSAVLADAMRLAPQERELVSRWLGLCVRAGLDLDPDSVVGANPAELSKLFGEAP